MSEQCLAKWDSYPHWVLAIYLGGKNESKTLNNKNTTRNRWNGHYRRIDQCSGRQSFSTKENKEAT